MSPEILFAIFCLVVASGRMHGIGYIEIPPDAGKLLRAFARVCLWVAPGKRLASTIIIAGAMALGGYHLYGWAAVPFAVLTVFGFSTGHGRFFAMNGANINDPKPEAIEKYFALWFWQKVLKRDITERGYSWLCMAVKGLLVGAPLGPYALLLAIYWPASYQFGWRFGKGTALGEWLTTTFAGIAFLIVLLH